MLTAESAEIAELKKNCMQICSAFLCELGGEILSFIVAIKPADSGRTDGRILRCLFGARCRAVLGFDPDARHYLYRLLTINH